MSKFPSDQDERLWLYIQAALLQGRELDTNPSPATAASAAPSPGSNGIQLPQHPLPHRDLVNGRKNSEEEEIDDDEETALNEQEIDDDEDTAMVAAAAPAPAQPMF